MKKIKISQQISNENTDALSKYMRDIYKLQMITPDYEVVLCEKIKNNDKQALESLIKANLRFVISVAKQYQNQGLSLSDLISEGNIGLIKAAMRFDSTKGFKFISYAVWWIRQSILQAISENSRVIRLPQNKVLLSNKIQKTYNTMFQKFEREPTVEEIANELKIEPSIVKIILDKNEKTSSLDSPISNNDDDYCLADLIANKEFENSEIEENIKDILTDLNEIECQIIKMYYGIGFPHRFTLEDIAHHLNMRKEAVRQMKNKIIARIRKKFKPQIS